MMWKGGKNPSCTKWMVLYINIRNAKIQKNFKENKWMPINIKHKYILEIVH